MSPRITRTHLLVLPTHNAHPHFPSRIWAKSAHYTWQNMVLIFKRTLERKIRILLDFVKSASSHQIP